MKDYSATMNLRDEILDTHAHANDPQLEELLHPQKPPERFRLLIISIPGNEASGCFDYNPLPVLFPPPDFLFIVTIVMSLLALLFSYDAVAGERQSGTLRLVIANSVSRTKVLLAKFLGGMASLLIPFLLALLIGVFCISVNPAIQWDRSAWAELALLTAVSITYIMSFYLLGLLVSSFAKHSTVAILNCLFLWVLLVLVIPNVCPYISAQLYRIASVAETRRRTGEIEIQSIAVARDIMKAAAQKLRSQYGTRFAEFESMEFGGISTWLFLGREAAPEQTKAARQRAEADPEFKAMMDAFRQEFSRAIEELRRIRRANPVEEDLRRKAALQTKLAKTLACISPVASLIYVARDLTGTGLRNLDYFARVADEYEEQVRSYLDTKVQGARRNHALEEDPGLDVSDRPRFVFTEEPLKYKVHAVLPYWGILGSFNIVFFVAAFAKFMTYDVR